MNDEFSFGLLQDLLQDLLRSSVSNKNRDLMLGRKTQTLYMVLESAA